MRVAPVMIISLLRKIEVVLCALKNDFSCYDIALLRVTEGMASL